MSQLVVQPGSWTSTNSALVESFLAGITILLGLTEKRKNFLNKIHEDIHGSYTIDEHYKQICTIVGRWPSKLVLSKIMEYCDTDHKKQLKIWYQELLAMEPMDDVHKMIKIMILPPLSNTIDTF